MVKRLVNRPFIPIVLSLLTFLLGIGVDSPSHAEELELELLEVRKIWDSAPHNAFTDLVRFQDTFYCAFREGVGHAGDRGSLRVIRSTDGREWESVALLSDEVFDLRDAALCVMPDQRLMVLGGAQHVVDGVRKTGTFVSFSGDGMRFSEPQIVIEPGRWLWRVTWHEGQAYGVTYGAPDHITRSGLLRTNDGVAYETVTETLFDDGQRPTEARVRFDNASKAYCLHRRDGRTQNSAMLGIAEAPYADWEWFDLGLRLGGPNFIRLPSGEWLAAGRLYDGEVRTEVLHLDVDEKSMQPMLRLPSAGDTSYPGMVWHQDRLWLSYYSSHEGKTSIYLAVIKVNR